MSRWQNQARHLTLAFTVMFSMVLAPARCQRLEAIGKWQVDGPEDLLYDPSGGGVIYTGCGDGWIKRVTVNDTVADTVAQDWVNTGGRPLGLALASNGDIFVADAYKGLVRVTREGNVEVLVDEVEGLKFKLTDGVAVAEDGIVYFTDASYKYGLQGLVLELLEGMPHGRLISYDPSTHQTTLLVSDLYLANGVAVSPDQQSVVFCETLRRRCRKYYIMGSKKGMIEDFIEDLPGLPDNIHYDALFSQHYWIGMAMDLDTTKNSGGVVSVDLEGQVTSHYNDTELSLIASGIQIGNFIYCGSLLYPFILRPRL